MEINSNKTTTQTCTPTYPRNRLCHDYITITQRSLLIPYLRLVSQWSSKVKFYLHERKAWEQSHKNTIPTSHWCHQQRMNMSKGWYICSTCTCSIKPHCKSNNAWGYCDSSCNVCASYHIMCSDIKISIGYICISV